MSYKSNMKWRSSEEINANVDRMIFEMKMNDYNWVKTLSIKPRSCYLSGEFVKPFTYAMVAHPENVALIENALDESYVIDEMEKNHVRKWISMGSFVFYKLGGKNIRLTDYKKERILSRY